MMKRDGTVFDCLINAESLQGKVYPEVGHENIIFPAWNPTGPQDSANWRAPYDPAILIDDGTDSGGVYRLMMTLLVKLILIQREKQ